jgi:hypothetical protein
MGVAQHAFRVYRVNCGCCGPTHNTVKAGHRHGAVLLVVRASVHPGVLMRPMDIVLLVPARTDHPGTQRVIPMVTVHDVCYTGWTCWYRLRESRWIIPLVSI